MMLVLGEGLVPLKPEVGTKNIFSKKGIALESQA